jgi:hypothetical protein
MDLSEVATVPIPIRPSATPTAAEAQIEQRRQKKLREIEAKASTSHQVLPDTEEEFRACHGLGEARRGSTASRTKEDLATLLQEERRQCTMPPLTDAAALVVRCPEVFVALARGESLQPLIEAGHLVPYNGQDSKTLTHNDRHLVRSYVREWTPTGETTVQIALDKFGADHIIQRPFVEEAKSKPLQRIRYVGTYVDAGRSNRLHQDGFVDADRSKKSRLLTFMTEHAPKAEWSSFVVEGLTVEVTTPELMPVDALFAKTRGSCW